jgi:hypothetical protein
VPISERSRSALYQGLAPITGEDAVGELLSFLPARDVEEPVSKELLRAEIADVRAEIAEVRAEIAEVRTEIAVLRAEMHQQLNRMLIWLMATIIGTASIAVTIVVAVMMKVAG